MARRAAARTRVTWARGTATEVGPECGEDALGLLAVGRVARGAMEVEQVQGRDAVARGHGPVERGLRAEEQVGGGAGREVPVRPDRRGGPPARPAAAAPRPAIAAPPSPHAATGGRGRGTRSRRGTRPPGRGLPARRGAGRPSPSSRRFSRTKAAARRARIDGAPRRPGGGPSRRSPRSSGRSSRPAPCRPRGAARGVRARPAGPCGRDRGGRAAGPRASPRSCATCAERPRQVQHVARVLEVRRTVEAPDGCQERVVVGSEGGPKLVARPGVVEPLVAVRLRVDGREEGPVGARHLRAHEGQGLAGHAGERRLGGQAVAPRRRAKQSSALS